MSLAIFKNIEDSYIILDCYGGGIWEFSDKEMISFLKILDVYQHGSDIECYISNINSAKEKELIKTVYSFIIDQEIPLHVTFVARALLETLENQSSGIISMPFTNMEVSRFCNYNCYWCFLDNKTSSFEETLSLQDMFSCIVDPMAKLGVLQWGITGGEPSLTVDKTLQLSQYIHNRVRKLYNIDPEITLFTNGYHLSKFAYLYQEHGITSVQVSISSGNSILENQLRRPPKEINSFDEVINGIIACKKVDLQVNLNSVISHDIGFGSNIDSLPELFDIVTKYGVDVFDLSLACPAGEAKKNKLIFTEEEYNKIMQHLSKNEHKLSKKTYYSRPCENLEVGRDICCGTGMIEFYIDHKGYTYPCNNLSDPLLKCSNKNVKEKNISEIWFNSNILGQLRDFNLYSVCNECGSCDYRGFCVGSCIAKIWHQFGSFSLNKKPDYCYKNQFGKGGYDNESH